ncbi:hypothetical protein GJ496_000585 [Pomphorhynchus laevis]|nr:hypothetical protein GJ496_000585 [Pomphorhynchus laevis]
MGERTCLYADHSKQIIILDSVNSIDKKQRQYKLDQIFDQSVDTYSVYIDTLARLIMSPDKWLDTFYICYGQTGTGKTFTIFGNCGYHGLIHYAVKDLFASGAKYIEISLMEIFGNQIYDLLNQRKRLNMMEDKAGKQFISELLKSTAENEDEVLELIQYGLSNAKIGRSSTNYSSSRSHVILQMKIQRAGSKLLNLTFVDIAGCERANERSKHFNRQTDMQDAAHINQSFMALKECIRGLQNRCVHLPFRQSKLTLFLKNALIGNTDINTIFMTNVMSTYDHIQSIRDSLEYAKCLKQIDVNIEKSDSPPVIKNIPKSTSKTQNMAFSVNLSDFSLRPLLSSSPTMLNMTKMETEKCQMDGIKSDCCCRKETKNSRDFNRNNNIAFIVNDSSIDPYVSTYSRNINDSTETANNCMFTCQSLNSRIIKRVKTNDQKSISVQTTFD